MDGGNAQALDLFILNITLTLRCTLKCKLCAADVIRYDKAPHFTKEFIFNVIDRCFEIVDRVERFQLSGGEPLLHKDFNAIVQKALSYSERFGNIGIFTNGTIAPGQDLIDQILSFGHRDKFKFYISHYGNISNKADECIELLKAAGIPYEVKIYHGDNQHFDGWIDYGNYKYQNYSEDSLIDMFKNCAVNRIGGIWSCRYGELHRCTRSASGMDLKMIPRVKDDYISLFENIPIERQKEKLRRIMSKQYLTACKYCSGDFGTGDKQKRYPAAEQIK
ncbi:MAG: hypothetical protein LBK66_08470 [Spirochaetaceae bacterium]|jgi:hypothetical protein|nr:hypothetical protein [Spirochaetaceae bacterium]